MPKPQSSTTSRKKAWLAILFATSLLVAILSPYILTPVFCQDNTADKGFYDAPLIPCAETQLFLVLAGFATPVILGALAWLIVKKASKHTKK